VTDPIPDVPRVRPPRDRLLAVVSCVGVITCIAMTLLEFSRAVDGNDRSWAYTFEWPVFAGVIIWIWRRLEQRHLLEAAGDDSDGSPPVHEP